MAQCSDTAEAADIRLAAMNLLARREHSRRELRQKLRRRFSETPLLDQVLQRLANENLQSDERFAESFVRQRAQRGYGPGRVRQQLTERGLDDEAVSHAFTAAEVDWCAVASRAYQKKFGDSGCADISDKSRRIRFMQYRGFYPDQFRNLVDSN